MPQATVFVVDDSQADRNMICKRIRTSDSSINVVEFGSMMDCYGSILREKPDWLVIDDHMETISANETLALIRRLRFAGRIIVVSGIQVPMRREKLISLGAQDYLSKDDIFDDPSVLMRHLVFENSTSPDLSLSVA